jgi:hypothetical protein
MMMFLSVDVSRCDHPLRGSIFWPPEDLFWKRSYEEKMTDVGHNIKLPHKQQIKKQYNFWQNMR